MRKILFVAVLCLTAFCGIANAGRYYDQTVISTSTTKATKYFSGDIYVYPNLSSYATSYSLENGSITLTGTVDGIDLSALNTSITTTYLTVSSATATYLQNSSATATYLSQSSATATYLALSSATATYLDKSSATLTYLQLSSATATYLDKSSATATYLDKSSATATYLDKSSATITYLGVSSAVATYPQFADKSSLVANDLFRWDGAQLVRIASGTTAGSYLKQDFSWDTPAGSGDMAKAVYDTDSNNKADFSDNSIQFSTHTYDHYVNTATYQTVGGSKTFSSSVYCSSHVYLSDGGKLVLSGTSTYISVPSNNQICFYAIGNNLLFMSSDTVNGGRVGVQSKVKLSLDGGGGTYIEEADGQLNVYNAGSVNMMFYAADPSIVFYKTLRPAGTSINIGTASDYVNTIHYHTLTAHSLKEINNKEQALEKVKAISIEDKSSYPEEVFVPAEKATADILDEKGEVKYKKGDKIGADGTDINQLLVYLIESVKLLEAKNAELEKRIEVLEKK